LSFFSKVFRNSEARASVSIIELVFLLIFTILAFLEGEMKKPWEGGATPPHDSVLPPPPPKVQRRKQRPSHTAT
jgi:hypothetical protein